MTGLTSRQAWTHDHIHRCLTCGAWEVITDAEKRMRQADLMSTPDVCQHLNPEAFEETA